VASLGGDEARARARSAVTLGGLEGGDAMSQRQLVEARIEHGFGAYQRNSGSTAADELQPIGAGQHLRRHHERKVDLRVTALFDSREAFGRDSENCVSAAVDADFTPGDLRRRTEAPLPQTVLDPPHRVPAP